MVNIVVAFPKPEDAKAIKNILIKNGYSQVFTANSGAAAISLTESMETGILISSYKFADMLYSEIKDNISDDISMLLIAGKDKIDTVRDDISYLYLPLKVYELIEHIEILEDRISLIRKKKKRKIRGNKDQELIFRAKEVLMIDKKMSEEEAHRYLQKMSMNNGCSIETVAILVINSKK